MANGDDHERTVNALLERVKNFLFNPTNKLKRKSFADFKRVDDGKRALVEQIMREPEYQGLPVNYQAKFEIVVYYSDRENK